VIIRELRPAPQTKFAFPNSVSSKFFPAILLNEANQVVENLDLLFPVAVTDTTPAVYQTPLICDFLLHN
jgi:hypothetical protein